MTVSGAEAGAISTASGRGAVASAHAFASQLAIDALSDGGNAFDAAFALAFGLCVSHPQAGNIGGGGYLVYREGQAMPRAISFREQAPRAATREAFLLADGSPDPDKTAFGPLSVCVPGTVKAFFHLHAQRGRLKTADILSTIADRAAKGAVVTKYEADCLNRLGPKLAQSPEARKHYVKDVPWKSGDLLFNPNLEKTLRVLAKEGEAAFYRDRIADQIIADLSANGGCMAWEDLATYEVRETPALSLPVGGRRVWTVPPEGGGAMLLEILGLLDREAFRRTTPFSADWHHLVAQACKLAFIGRREYLGDVSTVGNAAFEGIFNPDELARRFAALDLQRDIPTDELARRIGAGKTDDKDSGKNTTHFAVIDAEGNAVSCSYTMNLRYGSKWAIAEAGFLVNGSMDSFSFVEGRENYFGVVGSKPNLFAPGKRPCSNMAPTLVTKSTHGSDFTEMAVGTPGGPTIPTTLGAILAALLIHGVDAEEAIKLHRLHHQGWPDKLAFEAGFPDQALLDELAQRGYTLKDKQELISDIEGVFATDRGYTAISDWRREGKAMAR